MSVIAVIPARGGSKALPRKNILPLAGMPLLAHTIRDARAERVVRVIEFINNSKPSAAGG